MQENKQEKSLIKKNILSYLEKKGVTPYECYKKTGITRGVLSQNNGITEDNIAKFLAYYTDVSVEWLITGRGIMTIELEKETKAIVFYGDMASEPPAYNTDKIKEENERLIAENQKLKKENEESNKKLVLVQDSLIKLLAEKNGNEDLMDRDKPANERTKYRRVRGFRGMYDPRVHMLLKQLVGDSNTCK